jgi:hypothetical protein
MHGITTDYRERPGSDSAGRREPGEEEREKVREERRRNSRIVSESGNHGDNEIDRGVERARQVIGRGVLGPKISSVVSMGFFVACRWLREGGEAAA